MRKILYLIMCVPILLLTTCDVHEWPETPEFVKLHLRLKYETGMTEWKHLYDDAEVIEQAYGERYDNHRNYGKIRYIIRTCPVSDKMRTTSDYTQEFIFSKDISDGYDHEVTLDLLPGTYNVMVWSDLAQTSEATNFHDATNFAEIKLQGSHTGNNDYRDAFRGSKNISLAADLMENPCDTVDITMQRPLAKFEFRANDVKEFIDRESARTNLKAIENKTDSTNDIPTGTINIEDYKVVFYYVGFMPDTYSINTDRPVDSSTGVMFESTLKKLSESEASMGFDYVFVSGNKSAVTIQVGIYDNENTQISLTEPIEIPLKRSHHTILTGMFLMSEASGGVNISPDFDGNHNIILP